MGWFGFGKKKPVVVVTEEGGKPGVGIPVDNRKNKGLEGKVGETAENSDGQLYGTKYKSPQVIEGEANAARLVEGLREEEEIMPAGGTYGVADGSEQKIYYMKYETPSKADDNSVVVRFIDPPGERFSGREVLFRRSDMEEFAYLPAEKDRDKPFPYDLDKFNIWYEQKKAKSRKK